jgi:hypothetical protein
MHVNAAGFHQGTLHAKNMLRKNEVHATAPWYKFYICDDDDKVHVCVRPKTFFGNQF